MSYGNQTSTRIDRPNLKVNPRSRNKRTTIRRGSALMGFNRELVGKASSVSRDEGVERKEK